MEWLSNRKLATLHNKCCTNNDQYCTPLERAKHFNLHVPTFGSRRARFKLQEMIPQRAKKLDQQFKFVLAIPAGAGPGLSFLIRRL